MAHFDWLSYSHPSPVVRILAPRKAYNPAPTQSTLFLHPPPSPPTCLWQGSLSPDKILGGSRSSVLGQWLPVAQRYLV
ncbi:hypothetical protein SISSUDRAFT_1055000 [Sistotremastrum suecicum HHB10207 ss-3]|uniref:Uncharacterized protein n=1 Tax=Sistotremastrum suecicum HHB10207 ss-3 TaxID=1314776 RepID=A0A165Y3R9_9AGAM|nr:hypothetical protein SISSUDRAFT_1055000 [Sistotremastrum suecicum HHB10207 ss-3]